jgi:hypothetical protein
VVATEGTQPSLELLVEISCSFGVWKVSVATSGFTHLEVSRIVVEFLEEQLDEQ